jgi:hypothetical protein
MYKAYYLSVVALLSLASTTIQAQTVKGTRVLGLSAGNAVYQKTNFYKQISATLAPSVGTFVADNLALGINVPINYSLIKHFNSPSNEARQRSMGIGVLPWLRYYLPSTKQHRFFGEFSVGGILSNSRIKATGFAASNFTNVNLHASAGLGYTYFLTPNVGLESLLAYRLDGGTPDRFGQGALVLNLGFRVYLPKGGTSASTTQ